MAYARIVHTSLDGSTNQFDVTFPYVDKSHVIERVDGTATTAFTCLTATRIQITSTPASGSNVVITRETSPATRLVDYQTGSILSESVLDTDSIQAFYLGQEAQDVKDYTLAKSEATNLWDATSLRLTNLADPTAAQDGCGKPIRIVDVLYQQWELVAPQPSARPTSSPGRAIVSRVRSRLEGWAFPLWFFFVGYRYA